MPLNTPGYFGVLPTQQVRGAGAGQAQTGDNVFLQGANAGDLNSGDDALAIGRGALENNTGISAIALGPNAGRDNIGANIIAIGDSALDQNAGVGSIGIGFHAGLNAVPDELIAIGFDAAPAGIGDAEGVIAIGARALNALATSHIDGNLIAIGIDAWALETGGSFVRHVTVIGGDALATHVGAIQNMVAIGARCFRSFTDNGSNCVGVGALIAEFGSTTGGNAHTAVGDQALSRQGAGSSNTAIGSRAQSRMASGINNTALGALALQDSTAPDEVVAIGTGVLITSGDETIGIGGPVTAGARNVFVGVNTEPPTGSDNVVIGKGAGISYLYPQQSNVFELATREDATQGTQALLYGILGQGNLILGNTLDGSNDPTDRDLSGTNVFKILSGTAPSANPIGGGFLYVTAGALNYRGTAGTITPLAVA